jgi:glyoxylate/hydroxypyruvate reductase A
VGGRAAVIHSPAVEPPVPGRVRAAVLVHLDDVGRDRVAASLDGDEVAWLSGTTWSDELAPATVVFGNPPVEWIRRMPELAWIQLESVGYDAYEEISEELGARGIKVTNLHGQFAHPTAETAVAGILALYRGVDQLVLAGRSRDWISGEVRSGARTLHGATAVVLGKGTIGTQVRRQLEGFGCVVRTFARSGADLHDLTELDTALAAADLVISCLPSGPGTIGLFDSERIGRMQAHTIFANVGRGSVVDEPALAAALSESRLGGAVLDVTMDEPLPVDSPLWDLPRTILTQHTGGGYRDELRDKAERFIANLERFRQREPLHHRVAVAIDRER